MLEKVVSFVVFGLVCFVTFGQGTEGTNLSLKFKKVSLEKGLSQSSVLCILQDRNGFLWFGTRDGLNKYDGNTIKVYRYNSQDSTSLSNSYVKSLFQDANGTIWVGTRNGLNKYIREKDVFQRFTNIDDEGIYEDEIFEIIAGSRGNLWVGTNFGLGQFDINTGTYKYYKHNKDAQTSISNNLVRALAKTKDGNLWVKTVGSIDYFEVANGKFNHYTYPDGASKTENINTKSVLYQDRNNNLWVGLEDGLALFNKKLNQFEFFRWPNNKHNVINDAVRDILEDDSGNLWVGTYKGLCLINFKKQTLSQFVHDENNSTSLSQNSVYCIYQDARRDIWIGTYSGGVNQYDRSYDLFKHFSSGTNASKLNHKVVSSIIQDPDDNLWIGTEGGGINFYNKTTGKFSYYTYQANDINSLSANNVKTMIMDHKGNLWIGTHDGGLNFLNPSKHPYSFKQYKNVPGNINSLSDNRIISLFEDDQYNIWIGTSGGGINMLNPVLEQFTKIEDPADLVGKIVYCISKGINQGTLLIGGDKGLARLNTKTGELIPITFKKRKKEKNDIGAILCTYIDNQKNIWIGTEGEGLYYYNEDSNQSYHYGVAQGLPNDVIYGIIPDNSNNIWISTNYGLSRLNLQTKKFNNFDASDGLQENEFNYKAHFKSKNGELFFGGVNGFNVFDPEKIILNTYVPPVSITSFKVNNKPFLPLSDSTQNITLEYNENAIGFDFVALSYTQPNKNQYAYMLVGFDKEWNYAGNTKSATYTNLNAGKYTFKVKASNNDGLWNEKGASLSITILPAPWKTWWAYMIYTLAAIAILVFIRKYSLQRIHDRNELMQERLDKERIEEVNKLKLRLFTNISHDFRTPLTLIIGPLERMIRKKAGDSFIQKQHDIIYKNARVLMELINQLLDFRKSESGSLVLHASYHDIIPVVEDVKLTFEELANVRKIDYTIISSEKEIAVWFDKIMFKKIVFNLLSNAFKFTPEHGFIHIKISVEKNCKTINSDEGCLEIKIEDSGKGIPKNKLMFIFDSFSQENERFGTGIGLAWVKSLVELHKGQLNVTSKENTGTTFTVSLPLGNSHLTKDEMITDEVAIEDDYFYSDRQNEHIDNKPFILEDEPVSEKTSNNEMPTMLVVEDNDQVRSFIKEIFRETYHLAEANNGKAALDLARTKSIDIIISDVMMPQMDGIEFCHEIKSNVITSHIPVVLLTARTSEEYQNSGYTVGADAYVTKPFNAEILKVRVDNILKSRQLLIEKFRKNVILIPKEITATSADEDFLKKAVSIVEENAGNAAFTIQDFVDQMYMSRSVLYRKLKSLTDQSISEFIKIVKLKKAAQMISKTQMTISEIAFELGFNDMKHFRKSFREIYNMTPSEYREAPGLH